MTKKATRPDVARAANHLFRLALEVRISMYLRPPNYKAEESKWESHVAEITTIQAAVDSTRQLLACGSKQRGGNGSNKK